MEVVDPATLAGRVEGGAMASPAVTKASVIALPPHAEVRPAFPALCADVLSGTSGAPLEGVLPLLHAGAQLCATL